MKPIQLALALLLFSNLSFSQDLFSLENTDTFEPDYPSIQNIEENRTAIESLFTEPERTQTLSIEELQRNFSHIDPKNLIPKNLLNNALNYYSKNINSFRNKNYITVVDFSARSNYSRFFVVDMNSGAVRSHRVAHGAGGDLDKDGFVEKLSNLDGSHMSSRGYYRVSEIYSGKYGRSIRLDGLSSTNSKVRARAIVIHAANYVKEASVIQGLSWGCFALAWEVKDDIVDRINGGSLLYAEKSQDL